MYWLKYTHSLQLTEQVYLHTVHGTHALQVTICSHDTDDVLYSL